MAGLVLEAPFNCMRDEVMTFKAARALTWLMDIEQTLETAGVMFETNKWLPAVKVIKNKLVIVSLFLFWLGQELRVSLCLSVHLSVRLAQSALEHSFFLFLAHIFNQTSR